MPNFEEYEAVALPQAVDLQFVFPQAGPIKPLDPPCSYTAANLDLTYQQASSLWTDITRTSCSNALSSKFAEGDPSKAIVLIQFYRDAVEGYSTPVCGKNGTCLPLRGAVNFGGISCYANALLVAMFSRMENFEPLLYKRHHEDHATELLAIWLRLYVNLLRNGEQITTDIVAALLAAAVSAGWTDNSAPPLSQQDASEFFVFITEKLKMPLLALKVDIAHAGKETEEFDHKLIKEQLLYLPVPGSNQDPPILLEECFEVYFSNTINVSRHLSQPALTTQARHSVSSFSTEQLPGANSSSRAGTPTRTSNRRGSNSNSYPRRRSYSIMSVASPLNSRKPGRGGSEEPAFPPISMPFSGSSHYSTASPAYTGSPTSSVNTSFFSREPSIAENQVVDPLDESATKSVSPLPSDGDHLSKDHQQLPAATGSLPSYHQLFGFNEDSLAEERVRDIKRSLWTSNNEITLPAWMFLQLMPFYAGMQSKKDAPIENLEAEEVAHHFRKARPVLGLCLKRYFVDEQGIPHRNNRTVIVPETISMPSFVADDSDHNQAFGKFKLVLESAVFHRGTSIHSGHYCGLIAEPVLKPRSRISSGGFTDQKRYSVIDKPFSDNQRTLSPHWSSSTGQSTSNNHLTVPNVAIPGTVKAEGDRHHARKWYLYDDNQPRGDRIKEVDFNSIFEKEVPYMLFYRMVSLKEEEEEEELYWQFGNYKMPPSAPSFQRTPSARSSVSGFASAPSSAGTNFASRSSSRSPSPEPSKDKDKKKKTKFFRRNKDKVGTSKDKSVKDYASKYREEKCSVM